MEPVQPFKGQINIFAGTKKETQLNYNIPEEKLPIAETLMSSYSKLQFTSEEKRELSCRHRKIIHQYQSIDEQMITKYVKEFIKALPDHPNKKIRVKTKDFGSYICLAALYSGKMPENTNICFELEDTPIDLFPKKFLRKAQKSSVDVKFTFNENSWVAPFETLYKSAA